MSKEKNGFEITRKNFVREEKFGTDVVGYTYQITFNKPIEDEETFGKIVNGLNYVKVVNEIKVVDAKAVKPTEQVDKKAVKK